MKPKVYITRKIPAEIVSKLTSYFNVTMWEEENEPVPREVLEREIKEVDGLYCLLTEKIDADLMERAKKLKVISTMAVGYNNIDVQAATDRGIIVTNTPGVLTETTADLTFALLMTTSRRLMEASNFLRNGEWKTWSPMLLSGQDVHNSTIGIIGFGNIGQAVARRAKGFNMEVLYYNRSRKIDAEKEIGATFVDKEKLLRDSDFICVLTPFTNETKHLIDKEELSLMKKTSILINTSRGEVVNEEALYEALKSGQIWAAGLDVFQQEPIPLDHPLLTLSNVVTLPHIGSASIQTRMAMANLAAQNLIEGLHGKNLKYTINPMVLRSKQV